MTQPQRTKPVHVPVSGPPNVPRPDAAIFEALGQEGVFRLLSNVYKKLEEASIRPMFAQDMENASKRSACFFVQLLGGEPLFSQHIGPPRMRQRHIPFEIDEASRLIWLGCFKAALRNDIDDHDFPAEHLGSMETFLDGFSRWMVNVEPEASA